LASALGTAGDCFAGYGTDSRNARVGEDSSPVGLPGGPYENLEAKRMAEGPKSEWNGFDYQYIGKRFPRLRCPRVKSTPVLRVAKANWEFI